MSAVDILYFIVGMIIEFVISWVVLVLEEKIPEWEKAKSHLKRCKSNADIQ